MRRLKYLLAVAASLTVGCGDDSAISGGGGTGGNGAGGAANSGGSVPSGLCAPDPGGPYWVLETETLNFTVGCQSGLDFPGDAFSFQGLPSGASYDPATRTVTFTPGLDQAETFEVSLEVASTGEKSLFKLGVIDKWDAPGNVPVVDPTKYLEEYGLPVLFLDPAPTTEIYTAASVVSGGRTYVGAQAKLRGAASLEYPKNSYTIEFDKADKFDEPSRAFTNKRKIVLISTFDDNSYVRQRLAYDLWNAMDPGHLQIQTYSAVVFVNGEYFGLTTVSDHVDGFLMEDHGYSQEGNLYKAINHDANFRTTSVQNGGAPKQTLHQGYTKKEGTPLEGQPGAFDDLDALVTWAATSDDPTFLATLDATLDVRDYRDWFVFVTFILADDSAGKNSYHYHDPLTPGSLWRYAPWDFNASFGQAWTTHREDGVHYEDYVGLNRLFERFLALPEQSMPLEARYTEQLDGALSATAINARIDAYEAEIKASAERDEGRWAAEYQSFPWWSDRNDFTDHAGEIAYLKAWIDDRWAYQKALYP